MQRFCAIAALCLGTGLVALDAGMSAIALPTISRALVIGQSTAVLVVTVYQIVLLMLILPLAEIAGKVGFRRVFRIGLLLFGTGGVLCFFAANLPVLLAARAFQAAGAACMLSVSTAMIRVLFPENRLGRGMAIGGIVISCATALAPSIGGAILAVADWRWIFMIDIPFAIMAFLLGRMLPDVLIHDRPFNAASSLICAGCLGIIMSGLEIVMRARDIRLSLAAAASSALCAWLMVARALRDRDPILPVDLMKMPTVALSVSGSFLVFLASMLLTLSLPFRLEAMGYAPAEIGALLAPWPGAMLLMTPVAAYLSDRMHAGFLGAIGLTFSLAGCFSAALLTTASAYWDIGWRMALIGVGLALYMGPNARLIIGSVPMARMASAGALITTNRLLGQAAGAILASFVLSRVTADAMLPSILSGMLLAIAALCSLSRTRLSV